MHLSWLLAAIAPLGNIVNDRAQSRIASNDSAELLALNRDYIRSILASDASWFEQNLAPDFICTNRDGSLVDRASFLEQTSLPVLISNLEVHDVTVRVLGDFALIHARTTYQRPNGQAASSRYTDAWERRQGRWVTVSAQITPVL